MAGDSWQMLSGWPVRRGRKLQLGVEEGNGGLGSSHTVPFGTAVPARPPTRSWHVTRALCMAQWFCGASVQSTRVIVQDGHFRLASICGEAAILFSISSIHGHIRFAGWPKTGEYYLRPESKPRWLANQLGTYQRT